nr:MAG TPA: hypothetical protein [Caudoviricetes sp.]
MLITTTILLTMCINTISCIMELFRRAVKHKDTFVRQLCMYSNIYARDVKIN